MVHFKRKPITFLSPPKVLDRDAEVWVMKHTGELFTTYESYLKRLDYYEQKKFTCVITGHSGLTFFDAFESETEVSREVENTFPDPLREPLLRKVQFSTISRLDDLVTHLYDIFKEDFFPGEQVTVLLQDATDTNLPEKVAGTIRDKASFPRVVRPDGTVEREAMSRYFVSTSEPSSRITLVDNKHIFRDRKIFSKQVLRSFLKNSVQREAWSGAPWLVKPEIANVYHLDNVVPARLQQEAVAAEKKALAALRKESLGQKVKGSAQYVQRQKGQHPQHRHALAGQIPAFAAKAGVQPHTEFSFSHQLHEYSAFEPAAMKQQPPPVTVKYPIEDLDVHPIEHATPRPKLNFFSQTAPQANGLNDHDPTRLNMSSIGPLLEVWNTLNVHCEVFQLDSFTFDDFVDAMEFSSEDVDCELFVEIHCAVLKMLVDENGNINVKLPELPEDDDSDLQSSDENSAASTPAPEPASRRMRSNVTRSEVKHNDVKPETGDSIENAKVHLAAEMLGSDSWVDRLQKRDFRNGGWQVIIVGMLHQLSLKPSQKHACELILTHLAPTHLEPNQSTARQQYLSLDVNLRTVALEMACMLAVQTKTLREYIEECGDQMTFYRKQKIESQKQRKIYIEELKALDEQRKLLLPNEVEIAEVVEVVGPTASPFNSDNQPLEEDGTTMAATDSEEEAPHRGHSLRRGDDRANERKRKRDEELARKEQEKRSKAEASKEPPQLRKIRKDIEKKKTQIKECEDHIATLDGDLRENACQRTKVLGRDRFWNRYYWFERNGMPFAGIPTSSTSEYGYANGRLWVQGPDELERDGFINLIEPDLSQYRLAFGMSVTERKAQEEGGTSLDNARQWGYYDDPQSLDALIAWLDERGKREKDLRKELQIWRDKIGEYMEKLNQHLDGKLAKKAGSDELVVGVATRKKTYFEHTATRYPCLNWRNTFALNQLGHLHLDQPKAKKKLARGSSNPKSGAIQVERLSTRSGTRYSRG